MKLLLAAMSLALTIVAVLLTGKVMKPPAQKALGIGPNPEAPLSEHRAQPVPVSADVDQAHLDRVVRQNLFHPDRIDPSTLVVETSDGNSDEVTPDEPEESDADNFELMAIARIGERAAAVIKVLPAKPKPAVRQRQPVRSRVPSRTVRQPAAPAAANAGGEKKRDTRAYSLGDKIEETGYVLDLVETASVDLRHETSDEVITLVLDKFDEASMERRKEAASEAEKRAQAEAARRQAAAQQAASIAAKRAQAEKPTPATPANPPPTPSAPSVPATNATATQADAAAERAKRLQEIRERFRQRLEERRQQNSNP